MMPPRDIKRLSQIILAILLPFVIPLTALAQARGGHAGGARVSFHRPANRATTPHSPATGFPLGRSGFARVAVGGLAPGAVVNTLLTGSYPVPGLGFDSAHFAAINRNLGVRALIDPSTQLQLGLARQILSEIPAFPFVVPFFAPSSAVVVIQQSSPPVIIIQQAPTSAEVVEQTAPVRRAEPAAVVPEATTPSEPPRELSEYVLVRRDGALVSAIGVTTQADRLVYVTREGIRRSFPLADLDVDTTRRMNEERGISLQLSN